MEWKATDVIWLVEEMIRIAKKSKTRVNQEVEEEEGEEVMFITDIKRDLRLQWDFISQHNL